jgi:hypothetical protein
MLNNPADSNQERISEILKRLSDETAQKPVSLRGIMQSFGDRAFAILIVLFSLPSCIPAPPPIPLISGLLLLLISVQLIIGRSSPWLPRRFLDFEMKSETISLPLIKFIRIFKKFENWIKPRFVFMEKEFVLRMIGLFLLIVSTALVAAAPFIGQLPLGMSACLIGIGLGERDGALLSGGVIVGIIGISLNFGFIIALFSIIVFWI